MTDNAELLTTPSIEDQISEAIATIDSLDQLDNVFLVACGGSYALMVSLEHILQSSAAVEAHALNAREFTTRAPRTLGDHSLVISCSHSGNTPETVEATAAGKAAGAATICLTNLPGSPLDEAADSHVYYQHGDDKLYAYTGPALAYRLAYAIVDRINGTDTRAEVAEAASHLDHIVKTVQDDHYDAADKWAFKHARSELIYTLGSGPNYGETYAFAVCLLQEMQWIHSQGINSAEYFHGPFEITDFDVPFIETIGLGSSRAIDERAHAFVTTKSDDVLTLDAADWDLSEVPEHLRASYAHLVFNPLLRLHADRLADHRGHPLTVRRYMWRMEY